MCVLNATGAHYPHDPRMLDRLDEAGLLFWSETLGPSVSVEDTQDWKYFMKYQLRQLDEMLSMELGDAEGLLVPLYGDGKQALHLTRPK